MARVFVIHAPNRAYLRKEAERPDFGEWSWTMIGILLAILIPLVVVVLLYLGVTWKNWYDFEYASNETTARWLRSDCAGDTCSVHYEFDLGGGRTYRGTDRIPRNEYTDIEPLKNSLPVQYVSRDPDKSRFGDPLGDHSITQQITLSVLGLAGVVVTGYPILRAIGQRDANTQLAQDGTIVKGHVTEISVRKIKPSLNPVVTAYVIFGILFGIIGAALYGLWRSGNKDQSREARVRKVLLKIRYRFKSPKNGKMIYKTETFRFNPAHFHQRKVPPRGTIVAILYRNNRHFRLL